MWEKYQSLKQSHLSTKIEQKENKEGKAGT